jgi:leader peptidase (prepilin peptidase)/N-methyltransferase
VNAALAATGAGVATVAYWRIAADAAARRRLTLGTLPLFLPVLAGATAYATAIGGAPYTAVLAGAGAAVAAVADARTGSIFDPLTAMMLGTSLVLAATAGAAIDAVFGAVAIGGALLFLHAITGGRGLGLGDVKLGAAIGMSLGYASGLTAIAVAFVFGGIYAVWLLATKRASARSAIRFGPFIAAGTFVALLVPLGYRT